MRIPFAATDCGVGLKAQHYRAVLEARPQLGFFEVHAENYMVDGGPVHHFLGMIRESYPLSLHGVGLSIGAEGPLDRDHLRRLADLIDRYQPTAFSEHLAWSTHGGIFFNDLLPLAYDDATLARVCEHVDQVQQRLKRRLLLENPSTYVSFASSTYTEAQFIRQVVARTGCGLLLDVNNAYISCINCGTDAMTYIDALPLDAVGEIHLAGFSRDADAAGASLLIDSHGSPVAEAVWDLYQHAIARIGPVATLIEWDNDVPAFPVLLGEARQAQALMSVHLQPEPPARCRVHA
jgi:uncharacterized protein (UPF0276 family)